MLGAIVNKLDMLLEQQRQLLQGQAAMLAPPRKLEKASTDADAIDVMIQKASTNWKLERMAVVDRNILRIATYELRHLPDIPPKVSMNEAIEIAKRYGTGDSSSFINGILDKISGMP